MLKLRLFLLLFVLLTASALAQRPQRGMPDEKQRVEQNRRRHDRTELPREPQVQLGTAQVTGQAVRRINTSALNAVALDTRQLANTTLDLAGALAKVSGVRIRQNGGLGSGTQVNLNGFTGKHVKLFVDGVPMDGQASSFGLQNIPVTLAAQIEVYKGVVPVGLGGDALGGAINIVTRNEPGTHLDASYAYGSYQTHKAHLNLSHTFRSGLTLRLNAYGNASANNYRVLTQNVDLKTDAFDPQDRWYRRFHDHYHNEAVIVQAGVVDKPWADRLMLGVNLNHESADVQNANLMKIVFGQKHRTAEGFSPSLAYEKRNLFDRMDVRLNLRYDRTHTTNTDTATRFYNWKGESRANDRQGESGLPVIGSFVGHNLVGVAGLRFRFGSSTLTLSNTLSHFDRKTDDHSGAASQQSASAFMKRKNTKNILGLEYKYVPSAWWNAMLMGKHYLTSVRGPVLVEEVGRRPYYAERSRTVSALGVGAAGTLRLPRGWQWKVSYEHALRLPNLRELFGDGDLEDGAAGLRPERSHNVNLNVVWESRPARRHYLRVEAGSNVRYIHDYIVRTINDKGGAVSRNHGSVLGMGIDLGLHYAWQRLEVDAAYAYQRMTNRERLTPQGARSVTYGDQVPNLPFSFGNVDAAYRLWGDNVRQGGGGKAFPFALTLHYTADYVYRFFRTWRGNGAKIYIPTQFAHNAALTASWGTRYHLSLEANNLTDALLYDNYSLQKPGRNVMCKLRFAF